MHNDIMIKCDNVNMVFRFVVFELRDSWRPFRNWLAYKRIRLSKHLCSLLYIPHAQASYKNELEFVPIVTSRN